MRKKVLVITFVYVFGMFFALYPFVSSAYNAYLQSLKVAAYEQSASNIPEDEYEQMLEDAYAWNEELYSYIEPSYFPEGLEETEIYESLLNPNGDGVMGYVVIPKIDVKLPIYHYSDDESLQKGAGHMEASALPVGGESTHCVITAHRGLPNALMFTNLDRLEEGDVFYLNVLNETLAYEVVRIQTVDPDETSSLYAVSGEDLCTLVTCTPYGVNTERLLVTGMRIEYAEDEEETQSVARSGITYWPFLILAAAETLLYSWIRINVRKGKLRL